MFGGRALGALHRTLQTRPSEPGGGVAREALGDDVRHLKDLVGREQREERGKVVLGRTPRGER